MMILSSRKIHSTSRISLPTLAMGLFKDSQVQEAISGVESRVCLQNLYKVQRLVVSADSSKVLVRELLDS
jgi:hypothetical protein